MSESKNLPLPPCTNPCPAKFDQISAIQHGRIIRAVSTASVRLEEITNTAIRGASQGRRFESLLGKSDTGI